MTGVNTTFTPLPQGYYQAMVEKCEETVSKNTRNPMIRWVFSITEPEEFLGRKAYYNTMLAKNSRWVLKRLLLALGYAEDDLEGEVVFEEEDVIGLECTLVIVPDEYDGKPTSRVDAILEAGVQEGEE